IEARDRRPTETPHLADVAVDCPDELPNSGYFDLGGLDLTLERSDARLEILRRHGGSLRRIRGSGSQFIHSHGEAIVGSPQAELFQRCRCRYRLKQSNRQETGGPGWLNSKVTTSSATCTAAPTGWRRC